MATVASNAFELERRAFMWSKDNTLDDHVTSLLWDADPNTIVDGNSPGETKLYSLLPGATYVEGSTGAIVWWQKISLPNIWIKVGATSFTTLIPRTDVFTISNIDITNGYLQLSNVVNISNHISVNLNGSILFEGGSEDYTVETSTNRVIFTTVQLNALTINDRVQVKYFT